MKVQIVSIFSLLFVALCGTTPVAEPEPQYLIPAISFVAESLKINAAFIKNLTQEQQVAKVEALPDLILSQIAKNFPNGTVFAENAKEDLHTFFDTLKEMLGSY